MTLRALNAALLAGLATAGLAASARAGQYHVYACRTPSGETVPADGWSGSEAGPASYALNTCAMPGGALVAALGQAARTANTDSATWTFEPPSGASIASATLWRAADADGGAAVDASYVSWLAGPSNPSGPTPMDAFDECEAGLACPTGLGATSEPLAAENRVAVPSSNLGAHLYADASCVGVAGFKCKEGAHDANGYAAAVYVYAADVVLEQSAGPAVSGVGGELASASVVQGQSDVAFGASDPGSGVYEAVFDVDGQVVQRTVLDENGGRCRDVGQTTDGLAAFLYLRPCPASLSADVAFDTTRVGNGSHHLIVSVIDAAGNPAIVLDRQITVANPNLPGPPNGNDASAQAKLTVSWKGTRSSRITRRFGSAEIADGRLTGPGGVPISGALIDVLATPASSGAKPVAMAGLHTNAQGRFSLRLHGAVSSRTLRFSYRTHLGEIKPVASRTLTLAVAAGIGLSITPHVASVGRTIFFSGRLLGGPIPAGGKQLVLEARSPGSAWIEFDVVRTDRRGRFRASYRFRFPGPVTYQFRARSEPEADYPFAAGASNVVGVYEL